MARGRAERAARDGEVSQVAKDGASYLFSHRPFFACFNAVYRRLACNFDCASSAATSGLCVMLKKAAAPLAAPGCFAQSHTGTGHGIPPHPRNCTVARVHLDGSERPVDCDEPASSGRILIVCLFDLCRAPRWPRAYRIRVSRRSLEWLGWLIRQSWSQRSGVRECHLRSPPSWDCHVSALRRGPCVPCKPVERYYGVGRLAPRRRNAF